MDLSPSLHTRRKYVYISSIREIYVHYGAALMVFYLCLGRERKKSSKRIRREEKERERET